MAFASAVQALDHGNPSHVDGDLHHESRAGAADQDCDQCRVCQLAHSSALPVQPAGLFAVCTSDYTPAPAVLYLPFCADYTPRPPLPTLA